MDVLSSACWSAWNFKHPYVRDVPYFTLILTEESNPPLSDITSFHSGVKFFIIFKFQRIFRHFIYIVELGYNVMKGTEYIMVCFCEGVSLYPSSVILCSTERNYLVPQNVWRYKRGVAQTDVVITGLYSVYVHVHTHAHTHTHTQTQTYCYVQNIPWRVCWTSRARLKVIWVQYVLSVLVLGHYCSSVRRINLEDCENGILQ